MKKRNYSEISLNLTKILEKKDKKKQGIFFTPNSIVKSIIQFIKPYIKVNNSILEPSCGSCEFITELLKLNLNLNITAIEKNKLIYDTINQTFSKKCSLLNEDFLAYETEKKFDCIIGNPPYFVMKKGDTDKEYYPYFTGRPNIFILFMIKSLNLLKKNGVLAFVLPKNFLNCLYYDKTRVFINDNCKILNIVDCSNDIYLETKQETIVLIIQKKGDGIIRKENSNFILKKNEYLIFGIPNTIKKIKKLYNNSKSLSEMEFQVNVGTVVWNQHKNILTNDETQTRLIYSSDISDKKLNFKKYKNLSKKNFIPKTGSKDIILVVNRGYGMGNYLFEYCLIDVDFDYLIENHLIVIKYIGKEGNEKNTLREKYKIIMKSLCNKKTEQFIKLYFGNNAINTTELNHILPIFEV